MKSIVKTKNTTLAKAPISSEEKLEIVFLSICAIFIAVVVIKYHYVLEEPLPFSTGEDKAVKQEVIYDYEALDISHKYHVNYNQAASYLSNIEDIRKQFKKKSVLDVTPEIIPVMVDHVGVLNKQDVDIEYAINEADYFITEYQPEDLGGSENIYDKARFVYGTNYSVDSNMLNIWCYKFIIVTQDDLNFILQTPLVNRPILVDRYGIVKQYPDQVKYTEDYLKLISNEVGL